MSGDIGSLSDTTAPEPGTEPGGEMPGTDSAGSDPGSSSPTPPAV